MPEEQKEPRRTDEKLQKVIARRGMGSRRQLEQWISDGRVRVNGKVARLGDRVTAKDIIVVDGHKIPDEITDEVQVLLLNKPEGVVTSRRDPSGLPTVYDRLPKPVQGRWIAVGRLDINTTGLLLFTTDGELANKLMHPSSNIDREYAVRILGDVDKDMLERLQSGVLLEDGMARFSDISEASGSGVNQWYRVVIQEGRNREVRRLWESQGVKVSRLKRVRFGYIFLPSRIRAGSSELLEQKDVKILYEMASLPPKKVVALSPERRRELKRQSNKTAGKKGPQKGSTVTKKASKRRKASDLVDLTTSKSLGHSVPGKRKGRR